MKITETNVVQHLIDENEQAITFIIDHYGGLLASIIRQYVNYENRDFEECFDDVLLAIWQHSAAYDPDKNSFKQWIAAIAKYKAIDYLRKHRTVQQQQTLVSDVDDSILPRPETSQTTLVDDILGQLPLHEQTIFRKYYLEGVPTGEIADHFKANESWVYNKLSRGRKKLRNFLIKNNEI